MGLCTRMTRVNLFWVHLFYKLIEKMHIITSSHPKISNHYWGLLWLPRIFRSFDISSLKYFRTLPDVIG